MLKLFTFPKVFDAIMNEKTEAVAQLIKKTGVVLKGDDKEKIGKPLLKVDKEFDVDLSLFII